MDAAEQIRKFHDFIEANYYSKLLDAMRLEHKFIVINFNELAMFDPDLANELLENPEEAIKAAELSVEQFDLDEGSKGVKIRFDALPESQKTMIRDIRSKSIGKLIVIDGLIRQKSDVRPQVTSARFECPSCGHEITVLQLDTSFREPTRCGCGRKGKFTLLSKELVDAQRIVVEEIPEGLEGADQPKRISIFLRDDLVSPISDRRAGPGSKMLISGVLKEIPIVLRTGAKSTTFDLIIEANYVKPMEDSFYELRISEEEEKQIKELAEDPLVMQRLISSLAPSIYGHEQIKEALLLQMMGGVRKVRKDKVSSRGDIHILLLGDPGSGKSQLLKRMSVVAPKARYVAGRGASGAGLCVSPKSMVLTNPGGMEAIEKIIDERMDAQKEFRPGVWKQDDIKDIKIQGMSKDLKIHSKCPQSIWKLESPERMFEVTLSSGKKIELTANTMLFSIINGTTLWKKSMDLIQGMYVATPRKLMGGDKEPYTVDILSSNPVVHDIKPFVKKIVTLLARKYSTIRVASKKLGINENQLYHHWINEKARGNIKLSQLKKISEKAGIEWRDAVENVSIYNGKIHKIPQKLNEKIMYLAGLIAGDGDIALTPSNSYSIRLSNPEEKLHLIFQKILQEEFNLNYNISEGNVKRPKATRTTCKILGEILISLGIPPSPKSDKIYISNTLLHMPNHLLSEYIAGLYDTDGSVYIRKLKGSCCVDFTTVSEKLARQLQLALLRFEIHGKLRSKEPPKNGKIKSTKLRWILEIRAHDDIKKFYENIKIKHPLKKEKLERLASSSVVSNTNIDIVPGAGEIIKEILSQNKIPQRKVGWHKNFSYYSLKKILSKIKINDERLDYLKKIANSDIFWEKIINIQEKNSEFKYVYDLTVEDTHNFVVDGILVHNTATVVKDEFLRGWSLEAGALVLASGGICMIDEMDKMSEDDTAAMHEALEQQTVSVSKANVQATLLAQATVLAAANPKFGRFDPYGIVAEQIDMPPTLINRFDLIFPIRDVPEETRDKKLAEHILGLHQAPDSAEADIPNEILKKYIAYARQRIVPELTDAALEEVKEFYLKMRSSGGSDEGVKSIPISARQLEALVRLSEASAKARLSSKVTRKDAKKACELVEYCLMQVGFDKETGKIDIDRITTGISASARSHIANIKEIIADLESKVGKTIPIDDVISEAESRGVSAEHAEEAIEKLKRAGDLFEPRRGFISKI